jgi:hypothetical protein
MSLVSGEINPTRVRRQAGKRVLIQRAGPTTWRESYRRHPAFRKRAAKGLEEKRVGGPRWRWLRLLKMYVGR